MDTETTHTENNYTDETQDEWYSENYWDIGEIEDILNQEPPRYWMESKDFTDEKEARLFIWTMLQDNSDVMYIALEHIDENTWVVITCIYLEIEL